MYTVRGYSPCGLYFSYATNAAKHFERAKYSFLCSIKLLGDGILSEYFLEIIEDGKDP